MRYRRSPGLPHRLVHSWFDNDIYYEPPEDLCDGQHHRVDASYREKPYLHRAGARLSTTLDANSVAANCIDDDLATMCVSASEEFAWVEIDLGSSKQVAGVVIHDQVTGVDTNRLNAHTVRIGMVSGRPDVATTVCAHTAP